MREGVVLCVGEHERWWWGDECSVPSFEYAFMEIREMFGNGPEPPIFFHSHPNNFPSMSKIDEQTCRDLLFALKRSFMFIVVTEKTLWRWWCDSGSGQIFETELFPSSEQGARIISMLRQGSHYGNE